MSDLSWLNPTPHNRWTLATSQWPRNLATSGRTPYLGRLPPAGSRQLCLRLIQSPRPRQRQCLRYCEAEGFRGLKLTTSSNFTVPPTQRKIASRRRFCRLGGTSPCRSFPARGGLSLDARPWLPGAAEVSSAPHHGGRCARPCRSSRCRLSAEDGRHGSINRTGGIRVGAVSQCLSKFGRGVPSTAIAPTTSSQNGSTPKPGIASRASPGKSSHCRPSTMNSSSAVPRSTTHTIGGKGAAKAPMASEMPAMANARASRFLENLRVSKLACLRWSTVFLVP